MQKLIGYVSILLIASIMLFSLTACGSKRNPTGGAQDSTKPTVLGSYPAEFGDIGKGTIEISFSKEMDKTTLANSIYIYPPVLNKKVSIDKATLKIKLNEALKQDTNYFITLSTRLKDLRGNPLDKNQTLIFHHGESSNYRISGTISYEQTEDKALPIELSLMSPDSLLVLSNRISGESYSIDNLNPQAHTLRAYIDKNQNGRYDFGVDPFFEATSGNTPIASLNMNMAYADSTKPQIRRVQSLSKTELLLFFNKPIKSFQGVLIEGKDKLRISHQFLEGDKLSLLCAPMDSTEYTVYVAGAEDFKANRSEQLQLKFYCSAIADSTAPYITRTNPRNGASVNKLSPILEITFSELIPPDNISAKLYAGTEEIPLKLLSSIGRVHSFQPTKELINYRQHTLKILKTTTDFAGNKLKQDYELQFLPLNRK
ncbi:MAG: Ig-like domain-containing protein [Candidatus Cloacimonetes bacterium]|nr:Ig-like domain-containing protein [Candidatus Cloacimonadota bacterium]